MGMETNSTRQSPEIEESKKIPITPVRKRRRLPKVGVGLARVVLGLLFLLGLFLSLTPSGHAASRTTLVLPALVSAAQPAPLRLLGDQVRHVQKTIPSRGGTVYLDIYEPASSVPPLPGSREGLVLIPGVGDNRQVPQLINLSEALARTGIVVEDMTTPTLLNNDISPVDSDGVVQAFKYLARWPGVGANRIGIAGFSGGGPLACLAAVDPRIRDRVAFVTLFGSYFNAESVLRVYGRRAITVNGRTIPWYPAQYPLQVLADVMADGLSSYDGTLLVSAFVPHGTPLNSADLASMSPAAVAAYHLLEGDEPQRVNQNIAALSPKIHTLLNKLSPSSVYKKIKAPIYLLHSRDDTSLPVTESQKFAAALARIHHPYDYAEFGIFNHVLVQPNLSIFQILGDAPALFRILYEILLPAS
jgi:dienelactone hydrolase